MGEGGGGNKRWVKNRPPQLVTGPTGRSRQKCVIRYPTYLAVEDKPRSWASQRLVGRCGDHVTKVEGVGRFLGHHKPRNVRHIAVGDEEGAAGRGGRRGNEYRSRC